MAALADHIKPEKAPGQLRRSEQKKGSFHAQGSRWSAA